jgi:hypothetical protein
MSIKQDLMPGQIRSVASSLVEDNALAYFLENLPAIFAAWTSLFTTMASASVGESVVAAFDTVHSLTQTKNRKRLNLRFTYVHLNRAINARLPPHVPIPRGRAVSVDHGYTLPPRRILP